MTTNIKDLPDEKLIELDAIIKHDITSDDGGTCEDCPNWKASNRCQITGDLVFYDHKKCEEFKEREIVMRAMRRG